MQQMEFGRDVLQNRAGTCIDLTIFYASVCEASGLRSVVFLPLGHAFPAVILPDGELLPVESTLIRRGTFEDAVMAGQLKVKRLDEAVQRAREEMDVIDKDGFFYKIDIRLLRNAACTVSDWPPSRPTT